MTTKEYHVQQYIGKQHGWETVCTEDTLKEARQRLKEYRENQPEYPVRLSVKRIEHRENLSLPRWALAMEGKSSAIVSIGIVTNENPNPDLSYGRESVHRDLFKAWVRRMGLSYEEIIGAYGHLDGIPIEHPLIIYNCTRSQLIELARECYQTAVIFASQLAEGMRWEWIEYRDARADYVTTERRFEWEFAEGAADYYSQIKNKKFKIPFFDTSHRSFPAKSRYGKRSSLLESLRSMS